ncbi:MAG: hypothetical protein IPL77_11400 [Flavobacteriales bacterium]|nr:hypothetical protein [Flavobacteriales bacterium]
MTLAARIEAGTCECGAELRRTQEPVTIGGWYGDFQYAWVDGRVKVIDAVCRRCKERRLFTPVAVPEGLQDFLGVVTFAGEYPGEISFDSMEDAFTYLHRVALREDGMRARLKMAKG